MSKQFQIYYDENTNITTVDVLENDICTQIFSDVLGGSSGRPTGFKLNSTGPQPLILLTSDLTETSVGTSNVIERDTIANFTDQTLNGDVDATIIEIPINEAIVAFYSEQSWIKYTQDIDNGPTNKHTRAEMNGSGTVMIVGNSEENNNFALHQRGQVNVYTLNSDPLLEDTTWTDIGQINGDQNSQNLGFDVAIDTTGTLCVVGSYRYDDEVGKVDIYSINSSSIVLKHTLYGDTGEKIGKSVEISGDGNTIIVGCDNRDYVYIYKRTGTLTDWNRTKITNSGVGSFGQAIKSNNDGSRIAIGNVSHGNNISTNISDAKVYIYDIPDPLVDISGNDNIYAEISGTVNNFGYSIDLTDDGNIIIIGSPDTTFNDGAVQTYDISGSSPVLLGNVIDGSNNGNFGSSVSITSDGSRIAVGEQFYNPGSSQGRVLIYDYNSVSGLWEPIETTNLIASGYDQYGSDIDINDGGNRIAIGSDYNRLVRTYEFSQFKIIDGIQCVDPVDPVEPDNIISSVRITQEISIEDAFIITI